MNQHQLSRPSESIARSPLLLIDDNTENLHLLERTLEWGGFVNVRCCTSGRAGLDALDKSDFDLVILDLRMPGMDGYEFLRIIRTESPNSGYLPILVFTADLTSEAKIRALELGASDFLTKPGDAIEIKLRVQNFLRTRHLQLELQNHNEVLEARVRQRTEHLATARKETVEVLARAGEFRDDDTGHHCHRVGEMSAAIAFELGLDSDFVESIRLVAPLHDIGKIAVPDYILHKPGALTEEEYASIKRHVPIGAELFEGKSSPLLQFAREIALYHHECWDGSGYESGLSGEAIPISARIVTVADAFDAMTNDRPYRKGGSEDAALDELADKAGTQFDPRIVEAIRAVVLESTRKLGKAA